MLDNETVDINQIKDVKDDVEHYIENCQDPDFIENEMIYDDIDGLEEMLLDVSILLKKKKFFFVKLQFHVNSAYSMSFTTGKKYPYFEISFLRKINV